MPILVFLFGCKTGDNCNVSGMRVSGPIPKLGHIIYVINTSSFEENKNCESIFFWQDKNDSVINTTKISGGLFDGLDGEGLYVILPNRNKSLYFRKIIDPKWGQVDPTEEELLSKKDK